MADTPIYGFPMERLKERPGHTLRSDDDYSETTLAEAVETELNRVEGEVTDLDARVKALEDGTGPWQSASWRPIATGESGSVSNFSVDLTGGGRFEDPPLWNLVRVYMRFDLNDSGDGTARVNCRLNGDSDLLHISGGITWDADGNTDMVEHFDNGNAWYVAHGATISTNNMVMTLFHTGANPGLINFQAESGRMSTGTNVHRRTTCWGYIGDGGTTLTSLLFGTAGGAGGFNNAYYWVEGARFN